MKKLPIGIQSFVKLRAYDCLYIDKTKDIHRMITGGNSFFLSRPRRFGKPLLVSTMEEIFKGNKALFEGKTSFFYRTASRCFNRRIRQAHT